MKTRYERTKLGINNNKKLWCNVWPSVSSIIVLGFMFSDLVIWLSFISRSDCKAVILIGICYKNKF